MLQKRNMNNYVKTQSIILKAIFFVVIFIIGFLFFTKDSKAQLGVITDFYTIESGVITITEDTEDTLMVCVTGMLGGNSFTLNGVNSTSYYNYDVGYTWASLSYIKEPKSGNSNFSINSGNNYGDFSCFLVTNFDTSTTPTATYLDASGVYTSSFNFTIQDTHENDYLVLTPLTHYECNNNVVSNASSTLVWSSFCNSNWTKNQVFMIQANEIAPINYTYSIAGGNTRIGAVYLDITPLGRDEIIPITEYPLEMNPLSLISQQISYNICKYHNERYESNIINNNRYYLAHENLTDNHIISTTNLNGFNCDLFSQTPNNYWSFIYSSGITTGQKEFAFWIYDQQEKQIVAYIDDLIIDIVSDEYSSVSPLVPTGNIFNIGDKYLCKLEENCKLEYYYNFNLVPNYTNEISIWEFTMDENLNQNCWVWNEISGMNKCELIATSTIWEMGTFGKDEPIGKSFVNLTATSTPHTQRILMTAETGNIKQSQYIQLTWVSDPYYWEQRFNDNATSTDNILGINTRAMACSEADWTNEDNFFGFSLTRWGCSFKKWVLDLSLSPVNWIDSAMNNAKKVLLNIFPFNFVNGIYTAWKDSENINQDNNFLFASLDSNGDIYLEIPDNWQGNGETEILVFGNSIFKYNDKTTAFFSGIRATSTYLLWAMFFLLVYNLMFKIWNIIIGKLEIEKTEEEELRSVGQKAFISQTARNQAKNDPHKYPYSFRKTLK